MVFFGTKKRKDILFVRLRAMLLLPTSLVEMHSIARRSALEIDVYHVFDCGDLDTDRLQSMTVLSATELVTCHEPIRARIATSGKKPHPHKNVRERKKKKTERNEILIL